MNVKKYCYATLCRLLQSISDTLLEREEIELSLVELEWKKGDEQHLAP